MRKSFQIALPTAKAPLTNPLPPTIVTLPPSGRGKEHKDGDTKDVCKIHHRQRRLPGSAPGRPAAVLPPGDAGGRRGVPEQHQEDRADAGRGAGCIEDPLRHGVLDPVPVGGGGHPALAREQQAAERPADGDPVSGGAEAVGVEILDYL